MPTTTTLRQSLNQEEEKLHTALYKIYNNIQRDLKSVTWQDIQFLYHKKTDDLIRSSVTTIYEISARKTTERNMHIPFFLTENDLQEIRRLSRKYQDTFWLSLSREVRARNDLGVRTHYDPITLLRITEADKRFRQGFISRITESIHGETAASATLSKARQVVLESRANTRISNRGRTTTLQRSMSKLGFRKAALGDNATAKQPHLTWVVQDTNACPECLAFDGTKYLVDDPDIPVPSETTHPRCRCELVLEDAQVLGEAQEAAELFF